MIYNRGREVLPGSGVVPGTCPGASSQLLSPPGEFPDTGENTAELIQRLCTYKYFMFRRLPMTTIVVNLVNDSLQRVKVAELQLSYTFSIMFFIVEWSKYKVRSELRLYFFLAIQLFLSRFLFSLSLSMSFYMFLQCVTAAKRWCQPRCTSLSGYGMGHTGRNFSTLHHSYSHGCCRCLLFVDFPNIYTVPFV